MNKPEIKLSEWNKRTIGRAIQYLGEAFSTAFSSRDDDFIREVKRAKTNIDEFLNDIYPVPVLNNKEVSLARCLHTYSRKYMDSIFSCFVWQAINQGFGQKVWYFFIKSCVENEFKVERAYDLTHDYQSELQDFESLAMLSILEQWIENHDMQESVNQIIKDGGIED